jgi:hypothetical protein
MSPGATALTLIPAGPRLERERLGIGNNACLGGGVRRQKWCREHPGNRRGVADRAAAFHPRHDLLAHEIDGIEIQLDVTAPNIDAMPLLVAPALEPLCVPTARVVAKHVRVSAEFRSESVHRRAHLYLVSNVGGKSM